MRLSSEPLISRSLHLAGPLAAPAICITSSHHARSDVMAGAATARLSCTVLARPASRTPAALAAAARSAHSSAIHALIARGAPAASTPRRTMAATATPSQAAAAAVQDFEGLRGFQDRCTIGRHPPERGAQPGLSPPLAPPPPPANTPPLNPPQHSPCIFLHAPLLQGGLQLCVRHHGGFAPGAGPPDGLV